MITGGLLGWFSETVSDFQRGKPNYIFLIFSRQANQKLRKLSLKEKLMIRFVGSSDKYFFIRDTVPFVFGKISDLLILRKM